MLSNDLSEKFIQLLFNRQVPLAIRPNPLFPFKDYLLLEFSNLDNSIVLFGSFAFLNLVSWKGVRLAPSANKILIQDEYQS